MQADRYWLKLSGLPSLRWDELKRPDSFLGVEFLSPFWWLSESFMAALEKDARERAKRRKENEILANGTCSLSAILGAGMAVLSGKRAKGWDLAQCYASRNLG